MPLLITVDAINRKLKRTCGNKTADFMRSLIFKVQILLGKALQQFYLETGTLHEINKTSNNHTVIVTVARNYN